MSGMEIYTDGACRGNPGPGGWGVLIRQAGGERELSGAESATTNNRMELTAAIMALREAPAGSSVDIYTDSKYVLDGLNTWLPAWKQRGWKTADKKPVKNQDLWLALDEANARHSVRWHWVKGHSGHDGNDRVDRLANLAIDKLLSIGAP
ncbi:MAG TPA: ribonuclease HI [Gammaproteobacteria bacterium]|jgi:ribonuclease HI|nr:ribonuclease HI [Gammaproteobacteria bacterium]